MSDNSFTVSLPAQSISTFVGTFGEIVIEPRSAFKQIEAESYTAQSGIQTESCSDSGNGQYMGYIEDGDYAVYKKINFGRGAGGIEIRASSAGDGGAVEIRLDSLNGSLAGTIQISKTRDWQNWITSAGSVTPISGEHDLFYKFTGGDGYLFNLKWFRFTTVTGARQIYNLQENQNFKVDITKKKFFVTPSGNTNTYSLSVYTLAGQQILIRNGIQGISKIPVKTRGIYIINIHYNGLAQQNVIPDY